MATVSHPIVQSFVLKTASVLFTRAGATDADDFTKHIGEIGLTPTTAAGSWTGISGNVVAEQGIATWSAQFGLIQDLGENSFLRWLLAHEGDKAAVVATLASGADPISFTVTLSPASIGGAVGPNPLTGTVTMVIDGKPLWT